ncbi:hypothetical protein ACF0H5_010477 [Mactra antiquata]
MVNIKLYEGSIAAYKADVIVNSTNAALFLNQGSISRSIATKAGKEILDECSKKYPNGICFGDIAVTKGYKLQCKHVYHVALPDWGSEFYDALQTLCLTVSACLNEAHKQRMMSIAFPAMGCGFLSYPHDQAAAAMMQCISTFENETPQSQLKQLTIVIWNKGLDWKHVKQCFTQELSSKGNTKERKTSLLTNSLSQRQPPDNLLATCVRETNRNSCKKVLHCGHVCGGYKNEKNCLPCLQPECVTEGHQTSQDNCIICYTDMLSAAPAIMIKCGHVFHLHCAKRILQNRWVGPRINFNFTQCPICKSIIEHTELDLLMQPIRQLEEDVKQKAFLRLKYEGLEKDPEVTTSGGKFYNNPVEFAMNRYMYYCCYKCKKAYFGGTSRTECGAEVTGYFKPEDLICPECRKFKFTDLFKQAVSDQTVAKQIHEKENAEASEVIIKTTKPCPHCGVRTEKDEGCMHMTCVKCHGDWCWLCEKHWEMTCRREHWFGPRQ